MKPSERLDVVNNHVLCHNCFMRSHTTEICGKKSRCSVPGCGAKHSMFIHIDGVDYFPNSSTGQESQYCTYFNECSVSDSADLVSQVVTPTTTVSQNDQVTVSHALLNEAQLVFDCKSLISECHLNIVKLIEKQQEFISNEFKGVAQMLKSFDEKLYELTSAFSGLHAKNLSQSINNPVAYDPMISSSFCSDSGLDVTVSDAHVFERTGRKDIDCTAAFPESGFMNSTASYFTDIT